MDNNDVKELTFEETEQFLMRKILEAKTAEDTKRYSDALASLKMTHINEELGYAKIESEEALTREKLEAEEAFNRDKLEIETEEQAKDRKSKHPVLGIVVGAVATIGAGAAAAVTKGAFDNAWLGKVERIEKTENIALNTRKYTRPK